MSSSELDNWFAAAPPAQQAVLAKLRTPGFQKGALLDDPAGLLEGSGKELRNTKFRAAGDIDERAVRALLEQAARL